MPSTSPADTPPLGLERKLTSSIRRLQSTSISYGQRPTTSYESPKSQLGLHRLKSIKRRGDSDLSNDEALFYLSLPDKVRRQYFTREENILLRAACEITLSKHPRFDNVFSSIKPWMDGRASSSHSYNSSMIARDIMPDHSYGLSDSTASSDGECPPPLTRNFSLPRRRTMSSGSTAASSLPFNPLRCHPPASRSGSFTTSPLDNTRFVTKDSDSPGTKAKYFLDPKTRTKIRQYLSNSEAFDEMITFGFLADADDDSPSSSNNNSSNELEDDSDLKHAQFEEEDDFASDDTGSEPTTPGTDDLLATEWDFNDPCSPIQRVDSSSCTQEREMTLRVTLTKPEARSTVHVPAWPNVQGKGRAQTFNGDHDPLALEQLTFSEDLTGMHGAFAVQDAANGKGLKKLWKKVKSQRSATMSIG